MVAGSIPREGRRAFDYWAATWLSTTVHLKAKTRVGYESILRTHLMPAFGKSQVSRIDQPAIKVFFADMTASGAAPGTIRSVRQVLRLVLATAVDGKALASNPCDGVKLPRFAKSDMHFLTEGQVEDLATAIAPPETRAGGNGAVPDWRIELPEYGLLARFAAYTGRTSGRARSAPSRSRRPSSPTGRSDRIGKRGEWKTGVRADQDLPESIRPHSPVRLPRACSPARKQGSGGLRLSRA